MKFQLAGVCKQIGFRNYTSKQKGHEGEQKEVCNLVLENPNPQSQYDYVFGFMVNKEYADHLGLRDEAEAKKYLNKKIVITLRLTTFQNRTNVGAVEDIKFA